jgi:hypothetical protein
VGWLLLTQPWNAYLADPTRSVASFGWILYIAFPLPFGAAFALLYPHWDRALSTRSGLLKSMLYGALVVFALVLGFLVLTVSPFGYWLKRYLEIGAIFVPSVGAITGLCFHMLNITRSTRLPNCPRTPIPAQ